MLFAAHQSLSGVIHVGMTGSTGVAWTLEEVKHCADLLNSLCNFT